MGDYYHPQLPRWHKISCNWPGMVFVSFCAMSNSCIDKIKCAKMKLTVVGGRHIEHYNTCEAEMLCNVDITIDRHVRCHC